MKARITKGGGFEVERSGRFKTQGCPHCDADCGDWCPCFAERIVKDGYVGRMLNVTLWCCGEQTFSDVEDFRKREE